VTAAEVMSRLAGLGREFTPAQMAASRDLFAPRVLRPAQVAGCSVTRDLAYGEDPRHRLDLFVPAASDTGRPVFVFVHGGGFVQGDKGAADAPFYNNVGAWAAMQGYLGVALTYRLAPAHPWPAGAADLDRAVQWLRANVAALGGDPARIVLCGQSAGAVHVAGYVAGQGRDPAAPPAIAAAVLVSGIYDLSVAAPSPMHDAYFGAGRTLHPSRSTVDALAATRLPCLFSVCELDPPEFQRQALRAAQARVALRSEWPPFVQLWGHNHLSSVLQIGSDVDSLGPVLRTFIDRATVRG
jgi:acetyl esterase/lipase